MPERNVNIFNFTISFFGSISFCFLYLETLLLSAYSLMNVFVINGRFIVQRGLFMQISLPLLVAPAFRSHPLPNFQALAFQNSSTL